MPRFGEGQRSGRKPGSLNKRTRAIKERLLKDEALSVESTVEAIRRGQQYDPRALFDDTGALRPIHTLSEDEAFAIAGFDVVRRNLDGGDGHSDTIVKIKLVDRGRYVELAAKHQGMLTEKLEVSGEVDLVQRLASARNRAKSQKG